MSIGILINVHDGIVLAADSASTLTLMMASDQQGTGPIALNVYNNANKIANLLKGERIGCVAFGSGSIGSASISTLLKDFRQRLASRTEHDFDIDHYTMETVSGLLLQFLEKRIAELKPNEPKPSIGIMLGGYSKGKSLGEGWIISIEDGVATQPSLLRSEGQVGINWGGEQESISRLILGFSPMLPKVLGSIIQPSLTPGQIDQLTQLLIASLQAPLALAPMPIQDAIDLAEWLVHTAEMFSRFIPGPTSVGGPIECAVITKHEGFKWIRRKHYYGSELNPEVPNDDHNRKNGIA